MASKQKNQPPASAIVRRPSPGIAQLRNSVASRRAAAAPAPEVKPAKVRTRRTVSSPRFHEVLGEAIVKRGMSRRQLAELAGRDASTITAWLQAKCKPTRSVYFKLLDSFPELSVFDALGFEESARYPLAESSRPALVAAEPGAALSEVPGEADEDDVEERHLVVPAERGIARAPQNDRERDKALYRFGRETTWFHEEKPVQPSALVGVLERAKSIGLDLDDLIDVLSN